MKSQPKKNAKLRLEPPRPLPDPVLSVLGEVAFQRMVAVEKKRTERSGKPCLLMLLDTGEGVLPERRRILLDKIIAALLSFTRETDVTGWYKQGRIAGALFTEINPETLEQILKTMLGRLKETLSAELSSEQLNQINVSFRLFPEIDEGARTEQQQTRPYLDLAAPPAANRRETPSVS